MLLVVRSRPAGWPSGQGPKTHRLEATPDTVAYGHYWSETKPVLRIASGDIIDVDTLLTSNPTTLARAGVPDDKIQASLKAVVAAFPQGNPGRGPGGHILTGPVYVEGADAGERARGQGAVHRSADRLRLQRLLAVTCATNCDPRAGTRIFSSIARR